MPPEPPPTDSTSVALAREILLRRTDQIAAYLNSAGGIVWARYALLVTILAGFVLYVATAKKPPVRDCKVLFLPGVALLFTLAMYLLDWHQRNLSGRMKVWQNQAYNALLEHPPRDLAYLSKVVGDTIPDPRCVDWWTNVNPGLESATVYIFAWAVVIVGAMILWKKSA